MIRSHASMADAYEPSGTPRAAGDLRTAGDEGDGHGINHGVDGLGEYQAGDGTEANEDGGGAHLVDGRVFRIEEDEDDVIKERGTTTIKDLLVEMEDLIRRCCVVVVVEEKVCGRGSRC
jgi:hypothetical protein